MIQLIPMIVAIPLIGFWFWMLVDLANNNYISRESKNNWFLIIIFLNVFGAFWYYLVEYRNRNV